MRNLKCEAVINLEAVRNENWSDQRSFTIVSDYDVNPVS